MNLKLSLFAHRSSSVSLILDTFGVKVEDVAHVGAAVFSLRLGSFSQHVNLHQFRHHPHFFTAFLCGLVASVSAQTSQKKLNQKA